MTKDDVKRGPHPPAGVVAGIDFGTVRIGVALSDPDRRFAMPLETYARRDTQADARYFRDLATRWKVTLLVVGLPVFASGNESQKSAQAREFGRWLAEQTGVEVRFFDERYTTAEAESLLMAAELTSKQRKARRDKLAAQILLTAYLEAAREGKLPAEHSGPLDD